MLIGDGHLVEESLPPSEALHFQRLVRPEHGKYFHVWRNGFLGVNNQLDDNLELSVKNVSFAFSRVVANAMVTGGYLAL